MRSTVPRSRVAKCPDIGAQINKRGFVLLPFANIAGLIVAANLPLEPQTSLLAAGWDVQVVPGLDHLGAMQSSVVLPILIGWLQKTGWVK